MIEDTIATIVQEGYVKQQTSAETAKAICEFLTKELKGKFYGN